MNDLRFALRQLLKSPGFAAVAVVTLALGIGANTAVFSVVNAILLRPLPYPEPDRLVQLRLDRSGSSSTVVGSATYLAVRAQSQSLEGIAAYAGSDMSLTGSGSAERVVAGSVTAGFFPLLGVRPAHGRNFTRDEDTPGGPKAAIVGYGLWQSRFGGDPGLLGRTLRLNDENYTVVGILPAHFRYPEPFEIWTPLALKETIGGTSRAAQESNEGLGSVLVKAIARLKPGVTLSQAQAELQTLQHRVQQRGADPAPRGEGEGEGENLWSVVGLQEQIVGDVKGALLILLGAVAFVLLIACANIANLLLARAATRRQEMAVRVALGAGRFRICRQLFTESVLLSLMGGGLGLLFAYWGVRAGVPWTGGVLPTVHDVDLDAGVLAFTLGVSVLTGLVFGLAPAFQAWRADVTASLGGAARIDTGGNRHRLRRLLVVMEVALALVLLIGAGLLVKSLSRLKAVDPGYRPEGVLTFQVALSGEKSARQKVQFIEQIVERLNALPGVAAAAGTDSLPLTPFERITATDIEGRPPINFRTAKPGEVTPASRPTVTVGYFEAMGIPLRKGRTFTARDTRPGSDAVIVNEAFERHHFPGGSALGKRIRLMAGGDQRWQTVVGVVRDVRQSGLAGDVMLEVYSPSLEDSGSGLSFVARVNGDPAALIPAIRSVLAQIEPNQPIHNVMTMEQRLADTTTSPRWTTVLLGTFATVALVLTVVGIYGVMSYAVAQRQREIGVRMALGAQRREVLGLVLGDGLRLTAVGLVAGLGGALFLTRFLASHLYSVNVFDPATFAGVTVALTVVALLACWLPARRATRVDPMVALRGE